MMINSEIRTLHTILQIICAFSIISHFAVTQAWTIRMDEAALLTSGTKTLPPMISVPCCGGDDTFPLKEIVKPLNAEVLYEWYVNVQNTVDADPSWAIIWPTSVSLLNYLRQNPGETVRERVVVELGCGLGLPGIVSCALGASKVVLTDRDPFAMHCALSTGAVNGMGRGEESSCLVASILDWNNEAALEAVVREAGGSVDVVIASDVLYDIEGAVSFARICRRLLIGDNNDAGGCREGDEGNGRMGRRSILVTDPKFERAPGVRDTFLSTLVGGGNEMKVLTTENENEKENENRKGKETDIEVEIIDLPPTLSKGNEDDIACGSTIEGRDHIRLMNEATVLIKCTL